ncbi:MAG: PAS domain-containing sensor histidine kinase [Deltaproteobacteria bacterium]|nr:PAS domain-containing sensor histidine kinase [Deltaproteobacteria bacterium]
MDLPKGQYFELMPCYLTVQDREFRVTKANKRFREDFGEFEGRYCYQVYKRRSERCESCPVGRTFQDGQCHRSEEQVYTLGGREVSVIVYTTPITDEKGEITAVMEMSTDITEIKRLQRQLKESQERYHLLFEEVPCYISIQDPELRIVDANRSFKENFGDFLGCKCYEIYKHRDEECVNCAVQRTFMDGGIHHSEEVVTSVKGEHLNTLVFTAPIRGADGRTKYVMEMSTNITPIRQLQSQLVSIGMLISSVSHGIKGLLTGLDGGMYLVNTGLQKNNQQRVTQGWEMVQRNIDRIRGTVMNILYYAKEREPVWETVAAPALLEEVRGVIEARARESGVEVKCQVDDNAGGFEADAKAIRSLLVNLAENSVDACRVDKKKPSHSVTLGCRGDTDSVFFEVSDNGIGMDRETREKAFSLFFSSKGSEGTGLGLFIANKIAAAHSGRIEIQSEVEKGTRFVVTIPRRRKATVDEQQPETK